MHLIKQEFAFMELLLCPFPGTEKELLNLIPEASPGLISLHLYCLVVGTELKTLISSQVQIVLEPEGKR